MILGNVFSRRRCWEPAIKAEQERCAWQEVAVSGAAQGLHSCSCPRKLQLTKRWTQKTDGKASQKSKGKMLYLGQSLLRLSPVLELLQKVLAKFCYSWKSGVPFSLLCAFLPQPFLWQLRFSILVPKPAPSPHCIPLLLPVTLEMHSHKTNDPSLHLSSGIQFETHHTGTVLACRTRTGCGKHSQLL